MTDIECEELHISLKRFSGIVATAKDGIITINSNHKITYINPAATTLFGYQSEKINEEMLGMDLDQLIPSRHRANHNQHVSDFGKTGVSIRQMGANYEDFYVTGLKKNGDEFPIEANISSFLENDLRFYTVIFRDITERKIAKQRMDQYHRELSNLTQSLQIAREEERKHIARELHDDLGQILAALRMDLFILKRKELNNADVQPSIESMDQLILKSITTLRRIATDLRPHFLDEGGLFLSLLSLTQDFTQRHSILCKLNANEEELNLNEEISTTSYRIIQESLTNITRHAKASDVEIHLSRINGFLHIKIQDNGVGLAKADLSKKQSFGLLGMRERVYALKGELTISSDKPGTCIEVRLPI